MHRLFRALAPCRHHSGPAAAPKPGGGFVTGRARLARLPYLSAVFFARSTYGVVCCAQPSDATTDPEYRRVRIQNSKSAFCVHVVDRCCINHIVPKGNCGTCRPPCAALRYPAPRTGSETKFNHLKVKTDVPTRNANFSGSCVLRNSRLPGRGFHRCPFRRQRHLLVICQQQHSR